MVQNDSVTAPAIGTSPPTSPASHDAGTLLAVRGQAMPTPTRGSQRVKASLVGVLVAVAAGCGSTQDVLTSDRTGFPVTANSTVLSDSPVTTDGPVGVSAPADAEVQLPFVLTVAPATAHGGDAVHVSYEGDLSGDWNYGAGATLDVAVGDHWRTVWALINDSFEAPPVSITDAKTAVTVPAIGYDLSTTSTFVLPAELAPASYRLCQTVARSFDSPGGLADARTCAELTID